jgi:hypothetical protein
MFNAKNNSSKDDELKLSSTGYNLMDSISVRCINERGTNIAIKIEVFNDSDQQIDSQHLHSDDDVEIRRGLEADSYKSFRS